jgi:hypothetical protein
VAAIAELPARSCLIDGEAIVTDAAGLAVFKLIRSWRHDHAAVLCAFDAQKRGRIYHWLILKGSRRACRQAICGKRIRNKYVTNDFH